MKGIHLNALLGCFLLLSALSGPASAAVAGEINLLEVEKKLEQSGLASVIVEYESPFFAAKSLQLLDDASRVSAIQSMRKQFKSSLSAAAKSSVMHDYTYVPAAVFKANSQTLQELKSNPQVKSVHRNRISKAFLAESVDIVFPKHTTSRYNGGGEWAVAVLDSGVDKNHSFLKRGSSKNVISEACYSGGGFADPRVDILCPSDSRATTVSNSGLHCTGYEGCDHGTHVAGIAAGNGTVSDSTGFDGMASDAKIIAIQVFTGIRDVYNEDICGIGVGQNCILVFDSEIIKGLERVYALRNTYKIAAVNMSLGRGEFSSDCSSDETLVTNLINQLKSVGIASVVASGNEGHANRMSFPACIGSAIAIGATSDFTGSIFGESVTKDQRTFYSNVSNQLDLYAPGTEILSSVPGGSFSYFHGTSMAAPHVAGAFAILKQAKPTATVAEIESILKMVGPNVSASGVTRRRLDVAGALKEMGFSEIVIAPIIDLLME